VGVERGADVQREADDRELERILRTLRPKLGAILASFRIPPQDADDLLNIVLLQYVHKRLQIRTPETWLPGALRNECRMFWRTRGRSFTTAVDTALLDTMNPEQGGEAPQERAVMRHTLRRWVSSLSERCRSILHLRYYLGYETREVAEELGYSPASVDKVTRRCLDALGRKLAASLPAPRPRKESPRKEGQRKQNPRKPKQRTTSQRKASRRPTRTSRPKDDAESDS